MSSPKKNKPSHYYPANPDARKDYPELSRLTEQFWEQDWAFAVEDNGGLLAIEIVGKMFRPFIEEWLANPEQSERVQAEIVKVLATTSNSQECEAAVGIENELTGFFGIDARKLLENLRILLMTGGKIVY